MSSMKNYVDFIFFLSFFITFTFSFNLLAYVCVFFIIF